jgi:hypothetical protein
MSRKYTNVYTILEKVKKGDFQSYYKEDDGLFGKIEFYKKPDLVKPYMHYLDEKSLESIMDHFVSDRKSLLKLLNHFTNDSASTKILKDKKVSEEQFFADVKEKRKTFPKHLLKDIFKMYYHNIKDLEFEQRKSENKGKYKFLEHANNPVSKIMTESSSLKSSIFARNIVGYYLAKLAVLQYVDPQLEKDISDELQRTASNDFDNDVLNDLFKKAFDNDKDKNILEKIVEESKDLCRGIDQIMDKDMQEDMFEAASYDDSASKISLNYVDDIKQKLQKINISTGAMKEKIKKLLDKSINYFSAKKKTIYNDIFNSDNIQDIVDYEFFHPKLKKSLIEDIMVRETKSIGKIDVYVDCSGSMSSSCGSKNKNGESVSKIDFVKAFICKLKDLDLLNDLYQFDSKVKKNKSDVISISLINAGGGTDINKVVKNIIANKRNAIVLTDAEDHCANYSELAYFIGVKGAQFHYFESTVLEQYVNSSQIIVFDGEKINQVDKKGHIL